MCRRCIAQFHGRNNLKPNNKSTNLSDNHKKKVFRYSGDREKVNEIDNCATETSELSDKLEQTFMTETSLANVVLFVGRSKIICSHRIIGDVLKLRHDICCR